MLAISRIVHAPGIIRMRKSAPKSFNIRTHMHTHACCNPPACHPEKTSFEEREKTLCKAEISSARVLTWYKFYVQKITINIMWSVHPNRILYTRKNVWYTEVSLPRHTRFLLTNICANILQQASKPWLNSRRRCSSSSPSNLSKLYTRECFGLR